MAEEATTETEPTKEVKLRRKYMIGINHKSCPHKRSGNSGGVGRKARAAKRGHGGGQLTKEMEVENKRRSDEARERRKHWFDS